MSVLRKPFSVLVVIYNDAGQFLLLQRADDPGFWQSVTGGIDEGETPLQTAYRELKEETGIDCHAQNLSLTDHQRTHHYEIRPQWRHRYQPGSLINTEHVFSVKVPNSIKITLAAAEHLQFEWLSAIEAYERAWSESNKKEIIQLSSGL